MFSKDIGLTGCTNQVRGLYCKLRTLLFPCLFTLYHAQAINQRGKKQGSVTCVMDRENEVNLIFTISLKLIRHAGKEQLSNLAGLTVKYGPQNSIIVKSLSERTTAFYG